MPAPMMFVGDIHLGRTPRRLVQAGADASLTGPAEALRRVVDLALRSDVQAVLLAGDVVDADEDRFEAWSHLRQATEDLLDAGIRVLGVAGNHDHIALPRLTDRLDAFHLLGAGGRWERVELDGVDVLGWSFPDRHHRADPLQSPGLQGALDARRAGVPAVGLLHCDLDASSSLYAPVSSASLRALGLDAFFLGHIHQPGNLGHPGAIGYLGSLVGLDRGETGPRGPWLVQVDDRGRLVARQHAIGPVAWMRIDVDLADGEIDDGPDAEDRLHARLEQAVARSLAEADWLARGKVEAVGVSVTLTGRCDAREGLDALVTRTPSERRYDRQGMLVSVVAVHDATRPVVDLDTLAQERTPLGQVVRLLRALDDHGLGGVPEELRASFEKLDWTPWRKDEEHVPAPDMLTTLRASARRTIDSLLAQQETS